jgi:hypothetical protein
VCGRVAFYFVLLCVCFVSVCCYRYDLYPSDAREALLVSMLVFTSVGTQAFVRACIYMYGRSYVRMYDVHMYVLLHTCIYVCTDLCLYVCEYLCLYECVCLFFFVSMYECMSVCIYLC